MRDTPASNLLSDEIPDVTHGNWLIIDKSLLIL